MQLGGVWGAGFGADDLDQRADAGTGCCGHNTMICAIELDTGVRTDELGLNGASGSPSVERAGHGDAVDQRTGWQSTSGRWRRWSARTALASTMDVLLSEYLSGW